MPNNQHAKRLRVVEGTGKDSGDGPPTRKIASTVVVSVDENGILFDIGVDVKDEHVMQILRGLLMAQLRLIDRLSD